ncbi:hypothetical protein ES703_52008 [subsurface metagenome]
MLGFGFPFCNKPQNQDPLIEVHLLNEDTVPYTVHIGTSGQITPTFAKNFVIYLYRFPKLQPRPKKKGNILRKNLR